MNKSKGNMYEFVTHTWNPLAGECPHRCSYCSTNKLSSRYPVIKAKYSGEPRLDDRQMADNLGKDNFIFVCAQNDLFACGVPAEIIISILDKCCRYDNRYLFQTKNPDRILGFIDRLPPGKSVICTTIESDIDYEVYSSIDAYSNQRLRACAMSEIELLKYVTIEPIMDFDLDEMTKLIYKCDPVQVNIGADSGGNNLTEPPKQKILELISELSKFTKVVLKPNLSRLLK